MDYAVLVGINAYQYPNALNGCLNDVADIKGELIAALSFAPSSILELTDAGATAQSIKQSLSACVGQLKSGDRFLFWYSGHGDQLNNGAASTDVICPIDYNFTVDSSVTVSDFHSIFSKIPDGVDAFWGSDSCHSGDLERDMHRQGVPRQYRRNPASFVPPPPPKTFARFRDISAGLPNIVLMSGCRSDQTSADAYISDRYNGAFTHFFVQTIQAPNGLGTPLSALLPEIQAALQAGGYPQIPQLSGRPTALQADFMQP
jgi:hypothetical protein